MTKKIIVIGGGAAGIMAAGRAAELGADVILIEKMPKVGIKISITGKGRCNLTSGEEMDKFIEAFGPNGRFLINAFARFFSEDLINFFESIGVRTAIERGKRVFPLSGSAKDVVNALEIYLNKQGVQILPNTSVKGIIAQDNRAVGVDTNKGIFYGDAVILCTGGASYPKTGSTGDGYDMAKKIGHTIIPIRAALVPLEVKEAYIKDLQGLALNHVTASVYLDGEKIAEAFGEILFTHFGLSGPIILTLSKTVVDSLAKGTVEISLDLKPAISKEKLDLRFLREIKEHSNKNVDNMFKNLLPQSMIPVFIKLVGIPHDKKVHQITQKERGEVIALLKGMRFTIAQSRPLEEAIVTAGGVSIKEIDPKTMESKIIKGLYICGEVIDVDGKTGGYNLQAAFSTGWVAGTAAATER
ncbi:MAG: FAD-dependent oxidoreductase [Deltaproteobacteria bacterium RIFCSPLOWO2_12_FULL_43_16]|nr:MAG: FAD-dependent oxidoreductase [Deltaproteobacteria bacterium GWA2_43_19]OGQ12310.1 MAG: FAD-dependent oxidoreductase [Deltaproteobacteria bacterium RIFCSPHIGHO2_02_FULL_43_33]OGQ57258.1 MAG: FAD-dependent oxidoreductase [Deltaproteobacteria bacterium RIFCSPLOWO2_12_FULL_43_16]HBR17033.1 aminoacetone oxidase family FAD-binding enzyme [Deltaproteobacteria bacterium]